MKGYKIHNAFHFVHAISTCLMRFAKHGSMALYLMALSILGLVYWHGLAPLPVVGQPSPALEATLEKPLALPTELQNLARLLGDQRIDANMPLSPPSVVLMGVVAGPQNSGAAVMSVEGQVAKSYAVGDAVGVGSAQGWQLKAVTADGVLLARGAVTHRVDMPQQQ